MAQKHAYVGFFLAEISMVMVRVRSPATYGMKVSRPIKKTRLPRPPAGESRMIL